MSTRSPLFEGISLERPSVLTVSFEGDPSASLGAKLSSHDNGLTNEMFAPGYASVGEVLELDGKTLAIRSGVEVGDFVVAVNGEGFRRFPPDFEDSELEDVTKGIDLINLEGKSESNAQLTPEQVEEKKRLKGRVVKTDKTGGTYDRLLDRIREIKSERSPSDPLEIHLERYTWDSRVHSWSRFLSARRGNVPQVRGRRIIEKSAWLQHWLRHNPIRHPTTGDVNDPGS